MALSRPISCTSRSIRRGPLVTRPCDRRAPWQWSIRAPTVLYIHVDDDLPRGMCHNHCCRAAPHCADAAAPARMPLPDIMATCVQYFRCPLVSSWFSFIARSHACNVRVCGTAPQRLCASCASAAMRGHLPERVHLPRPSRPRIPARSDSALDALSPQGARVASTRAVSPRRGTLPAAGLHQHSSARRPRDRQHLSSARGAQRAARSGASGPCKTTVRVLRARGGTGAHDARATVQQVTVATQRYVGSTHDRAALPGLFRSVVVVAGAGRRSCAGAWRGHFGL